MNDHTAKSLIIVERLQALAARQAAREIPELQAEYVRLRPVAPPHKSALPNVALRSALFAACAARPRKHFERALVASIGSQITYTGFQLDQDDLDAWDGILSISDEQGGTCTFTAYALLKRIGWPDTGFNRDALLSSITRLKATAVEIRTDNGSLYIGSLIDHVQRDEVTKKYSVAINPRLRALFVNNRSTFVDLRIRRALSRKLAKFLYGFYCSHAAPFDLKVSTVRKLAGSSAASDHDFAKDVRVALSHVRDACAKYNYRFDFRVEKGKVHVEHQGSAAQRRFRVRSADCG